MLYKFDMVPLYTKPQLMILLEHPQSNLMKGSTTMCVDVDHEVGIKIDPMHPWH